MVSHPVVINVNAGIIWITGQKFHLAVSFNNYKGPYLVSVMVYSNLNVPCLCNYRGSEVTSIGV